MTQKQPLGGPPSRWRVYVEMMDRSCRQVARNRTTRNSCTRRASQSLVERHIEGPTDLDSGTFSKFFNIWIYVSKGYFSSGARSYLFFLFYCLETLSFFKLENFLIYQGQQSLKMFYFENHKCRCAYMYVCVHPCPQICEVKTFCSFSKEGKMPFSKIFFTF